MERSYKLLIVDDEIDLLEPLKFNFEALGYEVFTASSGNQGLEVFKNNKVDAILTDIKMPDGNGIDLISNVKKITPLFPVVSFITGYSDLSVAEAYDLGASATFSKPFDLNEIHEFLQSSLKPLEDRWTTPLEESFASKIQEAEVEIGCGGFLYKYDSPDDFTGDPEVKDPISFSKLNKGELCFSGHGIVRWLDTPAKLIGIEFYYLEDDSAQSVRDFILQEKMVPYIPKHYS